MRLLPDWRDLLYPFWQRAPLWLRRQLVWAGSSKFIVGVVATCLNPQNQVLVLEHRFHNEYPWGLPGGWIERGETPLASVIREVHEETGLAASVRDILFVDSDGMWMEIHYLCHIPNISPTIQTTELRRYQWIDPMNYTLRLKPSHARAIATVAARLTDDPDPVYPVSANDRHALAPSAKV